MTRTIIISGEQEAVERAIAELKSNVDYDRIPVTITVKKEKK